MNWNTSLPGQFREEVIAGMYSGDVTHLPQRSQLPTYGLQILIRGTIHVHSNHRDYTLQAPCGHLIFTDQAYRLIGESKDCEIYGLAMSPQFGEELNMNIHHALLSRFYARPIWEIAPKKIDTIIQYFNLLRTTIPTKNRAVITNLIRSFIYFLAEDFEQTKETFPQTRPEYIAGQFLAMVEAGCNSHHRIEWYASEMCLTPKYVANVVKQVTGKPAGEYIDEAILRKARALLLNTPYSIQEIADKLGFLNQSHFGTFFKRKTGLSPKQFRLKR